MDKPKLLLLTGPGGAGKSTLAQLLCALPGFRRLLSFTTRPPRHTTWPPEYAHVTVAAFAKLLADGHFVEVFTAPSGAMHGFPVPESEEGTEILVSVSSASGCFVIKERLIGSHDVRVMLVDAADQQLKLRMRHRGDGDSQIRHRLELARIERLPVGGFDWSVRGKSAGATLKCALGSIRPWAKHQTPDAAHAVRQALGTGHWAR